MMSKDEPEERVSEPTADLFPSHKVTKDTIYRYLLEQSRKSRGDSS